MVNIQSLYTCVFDQATYPKENVLAVGNSEGKLLVYNLERLSSGPKTRKETVGNPLHVISAHPDSVNAVLSTPDYCITGATGSIQGWQWDTIKNVSKYSWKIILECDQSNFGTPEINGLAYDKDKNLIYAACGDWKARAYDLETGKLSTTYEGHEDYVHGIITSENRVVSCGEDGFVFLWDPRAGREPQLKIKPFTHDVLQRPHLGKFIASVDLQQDWLLCGGGPKASIFHLRSAALTTTLPPEKSPIHVVKFTENGTDRGGIIVGGAEEGVKVCSMSGEITAEIPTSTKCVYTINISDQPFRMMTVGGLGPKIDLCLNLNYRDHILSTEIDPNDL